MRWAEQVSRLVPSAEQVKFTGSGTESTLLAIRVARSFTQRPTIVKLEGHFHGWQDYLLKGEKPPFESPSSPGIPAEVMATVSVVPSDDLGMLEERLTQGDVAALILEPSGGSWATIPLPEGYLQAARDLTTKYGVVLIFDEVITGFRWAPGGAQQRFGVTPDMTTMAKIVAGGMPGGAVAGQARDHGDARLQGRAGLERDARRSVIRARTTPARSSPRRGSTCLQKAADPAVQQLLRRPDGTPAHRASIAALVERGVPGYCLGRKLGLPPQLRRNGPESDRRRHAIRRRASRRRR